MSDSDDLLNNQMSGLLDHVYIKTPSLNTKWLWRSCRSLGTEVVCSSTSKVKVASHKSPELFFLKATLRSKY